MFGILDIIALVISTCAISTALSAIAVAVFCVLWAITTTDLDLEVQVALDAIRQLEEQLEDIRQVWVQEQKRAVLGHRCKCQQGSGEAKVVDDPHDEHFGQDHKWNVGCDCRICRICFPVDPGVRVRIVDGLFVGKEARILAIDTEKSLIEVQVTFLDQIERIWLRPDQIEKAWEIPY